MGDEADDLMDRAELTACPFCGTELNEHGGCLACASEEGRQPLEVLMSERLTIRPMKMTFYDTRPQFVTYGLDAYWGETDFHYSTSEKIPAKTNAFVRWLAKQEDLPSELTEALTEALDPVRDGNLGGAGFQGPGLDWVSRERFLSLLDGVKGWAEWVEPILEKMRKLGE